MAELGNANDIGQAAITDMANFSLQPAAGTFSIADGCNITLTGDAASEFHTGDTAVVAWNATDGAGTGRYPFFVGNISGNRITSGNQCGLPPNMSPQSGLTVYHLNCGQRGIDGLTACDRWQYGNLNGNGWNFYDGAVALYRLYMRSSNPKYLTYFHQWSDFWWQWGLNEGGLVIYTPRGVSLLGAFARALDGHPERFAPIYTTLKNSYDSRLGTVPDGNDNRESGYSLLFMAAGAKADPDPARHTWYCNAAATLSGYWLATIQPEGYWSEKNNQFPYDVPGVSPWREFSVLQGLARTYDVMNDASPAGCNNPNLATSILATLQPAAQFLYSYGRSSANRGIYYDVEHKADGLTGFGNQGPGNVSASLTSNQVTGTGTKFKTSFLAGTSYIGIYDSSTNSTWTYLVSSISDDTHLTIAANYGTQCVTGALGMTCAKTDALSTNYYVTPPMPTNCASKASTCYGNGTPGKLQNGDINNNRDAIWIFGWLYNTTGDATYVNEGDELFAATYGGPAEGPGSNFPDAPSACGGPLCNNAQESDYSAGIHACAANPTLPCNAFSNYGTTYYGNAIVSTGKRWAQGSGIGGADNFLAWRAGYQGSGQCSGDSSNSREGSKLRQPGRPCNSPKGKQDRLVFQ